MNDAQDSGDQVEAGPIRITIEIDRPRVGIGKARGHMRAAVREALVSLREVLDAGIQAVDTQNTSTDEDKPEKIAIE